MIFADADIHARMNWRAPLTHAAPPVPTPLAALPPTPWGTTGHGDGPAPGLPGSEALSGDEERSLMRKGTGEEEADAAGIAHDDGTDLEQTATQNPDLRTREFGAGQTDAAQSLQ